ncbi:MAG: type II secretion system protein [Immundisolibacteraceae bacterium]|nr:type II secretion system protein [Immundisolibacteraceae bacterium]
MPYHQKKITGFTLIEMVMVMVIIGIMAAYAAPRWLGDEQLLDPQQRLLARDLRHAQSMAMTQGRSVNFEIISAGYQITDASLTVIIDPARGEAFQVNLEPGLSIAGSNFSFDSLGRPTDGSSLLSAPQVQTVSSGGSSATVTVAPVSGFVSAP